MNVDLAVSYFHILAILMFEFYLGINKSIGERYSKQISGVLDRKGFQCRSNFENRYFNWYDF